MNLENLCILNASNPVNIERESDSYVDHRGGEASFFNSDKMISKCNSWHSISAAFSGEFFVYKKPAWQNAFKYDHVLVMVKDDISHLLPLIKKLRLMKKSVGIAWHENLNMLSLYSQNPKWLKEFKTVCDQADYFWNLNIPGHNFFESLLNVPIFSCWHGFPYEAWNHNFSVPKENREGIIIGTRTFSQQLKRNTIYAVGIANKIAEDLEIPVTYFSEDKIPTEEFQNLFKDLEFDNVRVVPGPVDYETWLKLIAPHKLMVHADDSMTLGQVVIDAALVDVPCVGSTTVNNFLMGTACNIDSLEKLIKEAYESPERADLERFRRGTSLKALKEEHEKTLFPMIGVK